MLLREKGVAGTTVAGVLEHSGGPRGSVRFHFPGGRRELLAEALREAGDAVTEHLRARAKEGASPREIFTGLCEHYARQLRESDFTAGCPVWAVVQESPDAPDLGRSAEEILDDWVEALGAPRDDAAFAIASLEGSITLSRLQRSTHPIEVVRERVAPLLDPSAAASDSERRGELPPI